MRRRRYRRRRTFGRNMALVIGVVAMIVLIAKRRATRHATNLSERVAGGLRAGAESARAASQELIEQAQEREPEEAGEVLVRGTGEAERSPGEDIRSIIEESIRRSRAGSSREAPEAGSREEPQAGSTVLESRADTEELPIEDYDSLNVNQVTQRLRELSVEEIERLQDYEAEHKNRRSLMQRFETRIRSARRS